ncbi:hypothetical protein GYA37_01950 [candidate division WWE3 bacterium]|uniref:Uncharacterized protein n=1 Tax=candidate division WWE3 bacterium TaxID=2053526 RepID=A0A7X9E6X0_UNCKA|nr:hypothetical protein [candidate division WWE3 bacterium]
MEEEKCYNDYRKNTRKGDRMKRLLVLLVLLATVASACSSKTADAKTEQALVATATSTATISPTPTVQPTSTSTPVAQPSPVVPVVASVQEENLTDNARVFYAVTKTLGLDLRVVECFEGSMNHWYVTYSTDGSLCFYVQFNTEDFPLGKPQEQSGMYMIIAESGHTPNREGRYAVAILDSAYLSNDAKRKLSVFSEEVVDTREETVLLNETIELPKELRGWWITNIVPLSNEQVQKLYNSNLLTLRELQP